MTPVPRFVVGTGRCGSTLLSRMLAEHRDLAAVHEFFTGLDWGRRFAPGPVSGADLADLIGAEQSVTTQVLRLGYTSDEITYPFDRPGARWKPGDQMPWLLVAMAGWMSQDPDRLYDELIAHTRARPETALAEHYRDLFSWLAAQAGKSHWVERSGSSIDYVGDLHTMYPDARIVHIHRDGPEAALSIAAHPFFRLALAFLYDGFPEDVLASTGEDGKELVEYAVNTPPPVAVAGTYWCDQVLHGYAALPAINADQWLDVRFEDLVAEPAEQVARVADFLQLPVDHGFADRAASLVGELPRSRFPDLPAADQEALLAACRPGQLLLGRPA
ncbi:MAG: hypothetical protein JWP74_2881 [Marmoricola sp.]|nr:hypothetical protein [Marmoricola sp.]